MSERVRVRGFAPLGRWAPPRDPLVRLGLVASLGDTSRPVEAWEIEVARWVTDTAALRAWLELLRGGRVVRGHFNSDSTAAVALDDGHGVELAEVADLHDGPQQLLLDEGVVMVGPALTHWWLTHAA